MITAYNPNTRKIILLGGDKFRNNTIIFDIATKSFNLGTNIPINIWSNQGQNYAQQGITSKYVWILIPETGEGLYRYDMTSNTITTYSNTDIYTEGYINGGCIAYFENTNGEYIIISGGQRDGGGGQIFELGNIAVYDIINDQFDTNGNYEDIIEDPRGGHTCIVHPNNTVFYVIGGREGDYDTIVSSIEYYNMTDYEYNIGNIQGATSSATYAVTNARSYAYEEFIFILGGRIAISDNTLANVMRYDIYADTIVQDVGLSLAYAVYDAAYVRTYGEVYLFGGSSRYVIGGYVASWQSQKLLSIFCVEGG